MKTPPTVATALTELSRHPQADITGLIDDLAGPLAERVLTRTADPAAVRALALDILTGFFDAARPVLNAARAREVGLAMDAATARTTSITAVRELDAAADWIDRDHPEVGARFHVSAARLRNRSEVDFHPNPRPHKS